MSKKTILAVDDSLTMRKLTESTLRQAGYEVILASSGGEGFKIALERRPNLVLLDYILPDMRGVEFCQQLQEAEIDHTIPILLISGHGNAIRELYQDFPNVVDYLTKPFAANVLLAVVSNILGKVEKPAEETPAAAPVPVGLDTTHVLVAPSAPLPEVEAPAPAELRQRVFQKLISHLHPPLTSIPSLEEARRGQAPSSYYLTRLLPLELIDELARELVALGAGLSERDEEPIRCPSKFASERHLMTYLAAERATGRLAMKLREETVSLYFDHGTIVCITSNNPRAYCAGSTYPFAQVARTLISQAMAAQRDSSTPFFITLESGGFQNSGVSLTDILRDCGHRCLARAAEEKTSLLNFTAMPVLPAFATEPRVEYVLNQILLESYRRVRDWQHISAYVPSLDYFVAITEHGPEQITHLTFSGLEADLLERINGNLTIQELIDQSSQPVFEVCHALFCLIRLDLAYLSTSAQFVSSEEAILPEEALAESAST
jgi:DNA-binding response OmpR family regulator